MLSIPGYSAEKMRSIIHIDVDMTKALMTGTTSKEVLRKLVLSQSPRGATDVSNFDSATFATNATHGVRIMSEQPTWVWRNCPIPKSLTFVGYGVNGASGQAFSAAIVTIDETGTKFPILSAKRVCWNFTMPTGDDGVFIDNNTKRVAGWSASTSDAATRFPVNYTIADVLTSCPNCFKPGQKTCNIGWWYPPTAYQFFLTELKITF